MASKNKASKGKEKEIKLDDAAQAQLDEITRLQQLAFDRGVIQQGRAVETHASTATVPARADGMDVVKKGNLRKNRYLLNISAQLSASTAGRMGYLSQLDTQNPLLYIELPEGRLKFAGTIFFPKNKYMTLRLAQKEVLCEDIFESMIVFSEHHWIGTKEENPEELPMPLPSTLQRADPEAEAQAGKIEEPVVAKKLSEELPQAISSSQEPSQALPLVRSSQRAIKRPKYNESPSDEPSNSAESSSKSDSGSDQDEAPAKGTQDNAQPTGTQRQQSTLLSFLSRSQSESQPRDLPSSQQGSGASQKRKKAGGRLVVSDDDEDSNSSESSDDSSKDDDVQILSEGSQSSEKKRQQPVRIARGTPSKLPKIDELEEEMESEEQVGESDDSDFEA